jgi:hypothetical protein
MITNGVFDILASHGSGYGTYHNSTGRKLAIGNGSIKSKASLFSSGIGAGSNSIGLSSLEILTIVNGTFEVRGRMVRKSDLDT